MRLQSKKQTVDAGQERLFDFLEDLTNYKGLMPDQVINWEASKEKFRFTVPGTADIGMRLEDINRYSDLTLVSDGHAPFPFTLKFIIKPRKELQETHIEFEADMPAMLAMMAKRPLQNLIDHMIGQLKSTFQG